MAEAAAYAGISTSTLYRWLADAHQPDANPKLRALPRDLRQAEAQAEIDALIVIQRAGATHWRAAAWWLQRTDVDDWGPVDDYGRRLYTRQPDSFGRERLQRRKYRTPASPGDEIASRLEQALSRPPTEEPATNLDSCTAALLADALAKATRPTLGAAPPS